MVSQNKQSFKVTFQKVVFGNQNEYTDCDKVKALKLINLSSQLVLLTNLNRLSHCLGLIKAKFSLQVFLS